MDIGRRIFYDKITGDVICDTGERSGFVVETTVAEDMRVYPNLQGRTLTDTDHIDLPYGYMAEQFANAASYKVDVATKTVIITPMTAQP